MVHKVEVIPDATCSGLDAASIYLYSTLLQSCNLSFLHWNFQISLWFMHFTCTNLGLVKPLKIMNVCNVGLCYDR